MKQKTIVAPLMAGLVLMASTSFAASSDVADAAMNRNTAAVRTLLTQKADVNAPQADGSTALHWAVYHEDVALVDRLLAAGASATVPNREGATPFYLACVSGNAEMMGKLLKAGVDVNGSFLHHGETPLMVAARTGRPEAVKLLMEAGAKVEMKETLRQTTALMWAAEQGHAEVIKLLIDSGADINAASTVEEAKKRRGVVYEQGENQHTGGVTPLVLAARQGNLAAVQALAEGGADLNKASGDGSSAMVVAVQNGHYNVARYLVEKGADVNLQNEKGWAPLYLAVKHRNLETGTLPVPNQNQSTDFIKLLLAQPKIDVNARLKFNTEIRNGQRATWLEEAGATPFLRAALCGDIEVMRWLLARGADPKIATKDGTTPLMAAAGVGFSEGFIHDRSVGETIEAMKLLLELGTDVNAQNAGGLTALHGAAHKSGIEAIKLLVENGASLTILSKPAAKFGNSTEGLLPLDWAQGVPVGVQSAIYHAEAVDYLTKAMNEKGIPIPTRNRTLGGNAAVAGTNAGTK
jgi:ankyrin repeat protein